MARPGILLLICDVVMMEIYTKRFEADGWDVEGAQTVEEAERKARRLLPRVCFLDARCELDIEELIRYFRSLPTTNESHLILYAPDMPLAQIERAKAAGVHDFILSHHLLPQEIIRSVGKRIKT